MPRGRWTPLPFLITFVIQVAFGSLFDPQPRLGIFDEGASTITTSVGAMEGIELTLVDDAVALRSQVEANDLDAGLVLPAGFDDAVRSGARPPLEFYVGGESLASNRIILAVTTLDLVRAVEGKTPPVDVAVVTVGSDALPLTTRMVPFIVMYSLLIAGVRTPAADLRPFLRGAITETWTDADRRRMQQTARWVLGLERFPANGSPPGDD